MPLKEEMAVADDLAASLAVTTNDFFRRVRARGGRVRSVERLGDDGSLEAIRFEIEWPEAPEMEDLLG
jgi:hypothetical protein